MKQDFNVKFGDIWRLNQHRLLCGDSTEKSMIEFFLKGYDPTLCVTDPPYGIGYQSRATNNELYQLKLKNDHIASWGTAFRLAKSPVLYVWFSFKHFDIVLQGIRDAGYSAKQMIIWKKNRFSLQRHLNHLQHEQCLVCIKDGENIIWKGDRKQTSVWSIDSVKPKERIHPTEKPVGIYQIPIMNHTKKGELVLDLFAGSGVIFEACESTKRIGFGIELCPDTCKKILERMEAKNYEITFERNIFD